VKDAVALRSLDHEHLDRLETVNTFDPTTKLLKVKPQLVCFATDRRSQVHPY